MAVSFSSIPPASSIFAAYASISAFIMLVQTMLNQLVPRQLQHYVLQFVQYYFKPRPKNATIVVEERDGMSTNEVYAAAEIYLCTKTRPNISRMKISKRHKDASVTVKFAQCERIPDSFQGIELQWKFVYEERKKSSKVLDEDTDNILHESEKKYFELCFDKKDKERVLDSYIPFVLEAANSIKAEKRVVKLHTLACPASYTHSVMWDCDETQ